MASQPKSPPGPAWYLAGCLLPLLGMIGAGLAFWGVWGKFSNLASNMQRVVGPGSEEVVLDQPGVWTVFYERRSFLRGKSYNGPGEMAGLTVRLHAKGSDQEIPAQPAPGNMTYDLPSAAGRSVCSFAIDRPGTYVVETSVPGTAPSAYVLALGRGFMGDLMTSIGGIWLGVCSLAVTVPVGLGILIVALVRRAQAGSRPTGPPQ